MARLNNFIEQVEEAFTASRRKKLYRISTGVLMLLMLNGVISADSVTEYGIAFAHLLGVGASEVAVRKISGN